MHSQIHLQKLKEDTRQSGTVSLSQPQNTRQAQFLLFACLLGALMGVVFIVIQPLFGMDTLTSRHAAAYQQLGNWGGVAAIIMAWSAHLAVSVFYGLLSGIAVLSTERLGIVALFTLAFSWLTTIIAPPANAIIVQLVSFQHIQTGQLPSLNFSMDIKFALHLVFFAVISVALYIYNNKMNNGSK